MTKQKDAVFNAVAAVKGTSTFTEPVSLSREERKVVSSTILTGIKNGDISYQGDVNDEVGLNSYISGLVSNWLRKDLRLNGGTKYVAKNPGTRTGSGDEQLKAMRALHAATADEEARAEIQAAIDARLFELKPKKVINFAALPDSLKRLVQQ